MPQRSGDRTAFQCASHKAPLGRSGPAQRDRRAQSRSADLPDLPWLSVQIRSVTSRRKAAALISPAHPGCGAFPANASAIASSKPAITGSSIGMRHSQRRIVRSCSQSRHSTASLPRKCTGSSRPHHGHHRYRGKWCRKQRVVVARAHCAGLDWCIYSQGGVHQKVGGECRNPMIL